MDNKTEILDEKITTLQELVNKLCFINRELHYLLRTKGEDHEN